MKTDERTRLFHTGFSVIRRPDVTIGRRNADFGRGFYLSVQEAFAKRWATGRAGETTVLNRYELDPAGLLVKRFERNEEWLRYVLCNRSGAGDAYAGYDLLVGPVAADTLFDVWGVTSPGLLSEAQMLRVLQIGPEYTQTVVKTEKAAMALRFTGAVAFSAEELALNREILRSEEEAFQEKLIALLQSFASQNGPA